MLTKIMERYVLLAFGDYAIVAITIDLWMSKIGFDIFTFVVNFINKEWVLCHITIGFFATPDILGAYFNFKNEAPSHKL
jgi:hypothetical protein